MIPIAKPYLNDKEIEAVNSVLQSGLLSQGEITTKFEDEYSEYINSREAVATNSGTSALHTTLLAIGIGPGDEVIVPSFSFIASATAISMCGARPVFIDIEPTYFTLNPEAILEAITQKTKAVLGVHLFGQPFDVQAVQEICEDRNILLVEDCAQAHGATYNRKKVGGFGDAGCFSFYSTKNMTSGEGGMITTDNKGIAEKSRMIINHGQSEKYYHTMLGFNYRMTNLCAAIGRVQLQKLDAMNDTRKRNAAFYYKNLDSNLYYLPQVREKCEHVYHQFVLRIREECPLGREKLMNYLIKNGIQSAVHYPMPIHSQPLYRSSFQWNCPVAEQTSKDVLSIPVHPGVSEENCQTICEILNGVKNL